jgi:MHS family proline/betaine transporter-like MFS transporter
MKHNYAKIYFASILGNIFEIFDFFVFVFLSNIIADLFFPENIGWLSIILTYTTITISYLLRPIGAIILGNLGDTYGRKSIFTLSILMTAIPSLIIGLSPTYQQIGIFAIVILLISRIFQGFSSGAEMPGAVTFIAELFHKKNHFIYTAWIPFGANISIAIGSYLISLMVKNMDKSALYSYGWRIPFLLGSLLAVIGFYIRRSMIESPDFLKYLKNKKTTKMPINILFQKYKTRLLMGIILVLITSLITSVFHVFLPNLFVKFLNLNLVVATRASSLGAFTLAFTILIFANLTKYIKPIHIIQTSLFAILIMLLLIVFDLVKFNSATNIYISVFILSVFIGGINGLYWGILVDLFPIEVRYSGIATSFSIGSLIGGGLTPLWTSNLLIYSGSYRGIIVVCIIITIISTINSIYLAKRLKYN